MAIKKKANKDTEKKKTVQKKSAPEKAKKAKAPAEKHIKAPAPQKVIIKRPPGPKAVKKFQEDKPAVLQQEAPATQEIAKKIKDEQVRVKKKQHEVVEPKAEKAAIAEKKIAPAPKQAEKAADVVVPKEKKVEQPKPREEAPAAKAKIPQAEPQVKESRPVPAEPVVIVEQKVEAGPKKISIEIPITVKGLAVRISVKPNDLIKKLMEKGIFAVITQNLDEKIVSDIIREFNYELEKTSVSKDKVESYFEKEEAGDEKHIVGRAPVVTFMGHVDHGKTSLLDYIRKTKVALKEKGGITQHMGAYEVITAKGRVTFLDTPGHEAFTAMRARGANATDVVVLVVAADDGVMPQTKEAIDHARAANVPIVIAINKCDLPTANVEKVKRQLAEVGLLPEDWGGKAITVNVSAKTGDGVEQLLEMLLLESELLELKANPNLRARGVVIESKLSPGRGAVATVLIKNGTLKLQDMVLSGQHYGRVRGMFNNIGERVTVAGPSTPVEMIGLSGVVEAGDYFFVVKDEKKAKTLATLKMDETREKRLRSRGRITLEGLYTQLKKGMVKDLNIILKADVSGSIGAIEKSLVELSTKEVKVNVIHSGLGSVNDADVMLSIASNAVIIGFNVKAEEKAYETAVKEEVEIKLYNIIYDAIADVHAAMEGLLEPFEKEVFHGRCEVRQVFKVTKAGTIAGCYMQKGKITRSSKVRLMRAGKKIYEGTISSLKRFKDDVRDVQEGFECGIGLTNHNDIKTSDLIEAYGIEKVARRLEK